MMSTAPFRSRSLILGLLGILSLASVARSQEVGSHESADSAAAQVDSQLAEYSVAADSLLAEVERRVARSRRLEQAVDRLTGDDQVVATNELNTHRIENLERLYELGDVILRIEGEGGAAPAHRARVEEYYEETPEFAFQLSEQTRAELNAMRSGAEEFATFTSAELQDQTSRLGGWVNQVHEAMLIHAERMEEFGLDGTRVRDRLRTIESERADLNAGRLRLVNEHLSRLSKRLETRPNDGELRAAFDAEQDTRELLIEILRFSVRILDALDADTTEYKNLLVQTTGDITAGLLDRRVAATLLEEGFDRLRDWFRLNSVPLIVKVIVFLLIVFLFRILSRLVRRALQRALDPSRVRISQLLRNMILGVSSNLIMLLGVLMALAQLGVSLGPLLAGLGVAGFIIGFALQEVLGNFAAGLMILIYRPYDVGDVVEAGGVFGKVDRMSLVSTTMLTFDNQTLVIPNGKIWGDVIRNVTSQRIRRVDLTFGISYGDDIPKAEQVLWSIVKEHDKILENPEPVVKVHQLGESSVDIIVRPWAKTVDYWDVFWDLTREVKLRFDREGISIPFPQRDVHVYEERLMRSVGQTEG